MNMRSITASQRDPRAGDFFALHVHDRLMLGRVISTDAKVGPVENMVLIYLYRTPYTAQEAVPPLKTDDLLIPPLVTNTLPWKMGFFQTIDHRPLTRDDVLAQHCFVRCPIADTGVARYYDEKSNELCYRIEPCGEYGVIGYIGIDKEVSKALGLPVS